MRDIVVGYDGSECADGALDAAIELAKSLGDKIVLVFGAEPAGAGGGEVPTHREAVEEIGRKLTARGVERAAKAGITAEVEMPTHAPAAALDDVAERRGARMIVVGSRGESQLKGLLLGSTPYKLLHLSKAPVLVVPG